MKNDNKGINSQTIDFVLPWVDGSDKEWLALKSKYQESECHLSNDPDSRGECRFRDIGLLKYWFRSVERFAPWVNCVFFITCGQKPDWLNESNPKLRLIDHRDYIPADYLPTFQSNTIELNLHRIPDLSEHFVLFNDDTFLLRPVKPGFFFRKGLPVLDCDLGIPNWLGNNQIGRTVINNSGVLNRNLDVKHLVWKHIGKCTDVRNLGFARAIKNLLSFAINRTFIPGPFGHLPQPHLKSTIEELWRTAPRVLEATSRHKFRGDDGVNQWLACAWNLVNGRFYPANEKRRGIFCPVEKEALPRIKSAIGSQTIPQICFSDRDSTPELEQCVAEISGAFAKLLPEKSSFEK